MKSVKETSGKVHFFLMAFVRVMLILALFGSFNRGRWLVFFVSAVALFVTFLPKILGKFWNVKIPADFEVMILLFVYGTLFFGEVRGLYAEFWWWDILLNLGAAIALGLVGFTVLYVLYKDEKIDASPLMIAIFAFGFAVSIGTVWEIFEFSADKLFGFSLQRGSLNDTMKDIIVNAVGAFLVSIAGYYYIKSGQKNVVSKFVMNFIEKYPKVFTSGKDEKKEEKLLNLINKGEGSKLEFKSTLRRNLHTNEIDKKIENSVLKTLTAYLNSNGGTLLVGVSNSGEILGVEKDGFENEDKLNLHLSNLIKQKIGKEYFSLIEFEIIKIYGKSVVKIDCRESPKPIFLKSDEGEEFYVRNGPASVKLEGSSLIEYVERRFKDEK